MTEKRWKRFFIRAMLLQWETRKVTLSWWNSWELRWRRRPDSSSRLAQHDKRRKGGKKDNCLLFSGLGDASAAPPGAWQAGGQRIQGRHQNCSKLDFLIARVFFLLTPSSIGWICSAESYTSFLKELLCSGCPDNWTRSIAQVVQISKASFRLFRQLGLGRHLLSPCTSPCQRTCEQHWQVMSISLGLYCSKFWIQFWEIPSGIFSSLMILFCRTLVL